MQSDILGNLTEVTTKDKHNRTIDPEKDFYPRPCNTSEPSQIVIGNDRLIYALMYLKIDRIKYLINTYGHLSQNDILHNKFAESDLDKIIDKIWGIKDKTCNEKAMMVKEAVNEHKRIIVEEYNNAVDFMCVDYYNQNVLHVLCCGNTGANLCYSANQDVYENIIRLFIKTLPKYAITTMLKQKSSFDRIPIEEALRWNLFHIAVMFLKNGSPMPMHDGNFIIDKKYETAMKYLRTFYCNKERVDAFVEVCNNKKIINCPITLEPIKIPAVLEDGSIYEKSAIIKWFMVQKVEISQFWTVATLVEHNKIAIDEAFCSQWSYMYTYKSPSTNIELVGEPIIYLPYTEEFIFI